jgi:hypothetical protein
MRTIETTAIITADGGLALPDLPLLLNLPPGPRRVVLVIDEALTLEAAAPPTDFPVVEVGPWPDNLSLRREDMYDAWGR